MSVGKNQNPNHHIALFRGKTIRKTIYQKEWWFSILDVIKILTGSPQPKTYWAKMKDRDKDMSQPSPFWEQLKMMAEDGKMRETDCDYKILTAEISQATLKYVR